MAIQIFTVGILAPRLPREVCQPAGNGSKFLLCPGAALYIENRDGAARVNTSETVEMLEVEAKYMSIQTARNPFLWRSRM